MLSATLGYALERSSSAVALTLAVAVLLVADALRRGGIPGLWLVVLAFCGAVSRLNVTQTETTFGALRVPLIVGGSLLAIAFGYAVDPEFRAAVKRAHP